MNQNQNQDPITYFAETDARNKRVAFGIKSSDRSRHMYVIGKTGMGKSTLLENMAIQDIKNGEGMAFIDPHGKTADLLLDYIPKERIKDVLYFAPFDLEYPISFNVMEDVGQDRRHLVANGLMSAFKKIWVDAWSARMEYILNNVLLALLEYPDATLVGVNRMLVDKEYRKKVVDNITDPSVKAFWTDEFAKYGDRYMQEAGAAIQNKIGQFISNPLVRNIIGQPKSTFDIRTLMDQKKILIVNLSKGRVGEANANLLGSMLITKIYLGAMSRADVSPGAMKKIPNFYLYVDEFQSFANESFADILSEARKYKLNLTIAHQYIEQMSDEVRAAVFGNVGSMIVFRVGSYDAEVLEKEFAPAFTQEDMVNLGFVQIYLKLMINGVTSQPFSATTLPPIEKPMMSFKEDIINFSRETYSHPRAQVEEAIKNWHQQPAGPEKIPTARPSQNSDQLSRNSASQENGRRAPQERMQIQPQPQARQQSPQPQQAGTSAREKELRNAISQNYTKNAEEEQRRVDEQKKKEQAKQNNQKKSKGPTEENISALRAALASIMKENQQNQNNPQQPQSEQKQATRQQDPAQEKKQQQPQQKADNQEKVEKQDTQPKVRVQQAPQEVPEAVLRKILEMDK